MSYKNINEIIRTGERNLAQEYYDLAVKTIKPKIEEYLNNDGVSRKVLKQRIDEIKAHFKTLYKIQYAISKIDPNSILKYKKDNEDVPQEYTVKAIDRQAISWLDRLTATLNILIIKQSEFDVKSSFRRDIFILLGSILSAFLISWYFVDKDSIQIICTCQHCDSIQNTNSQEHILNFDTLKIPYK
jgi:hypothetical protein